jgi:hypothetical protein
MAIKKYKDRLGNWFRIVNNTLVGWGSWEIERDRPLPIILSFDSNTPIYRGSYPPVLSWEVSNCDKLMLNDIDVTNVNPGQYIVSPKEDTVYRLTAYFKLPKTDEFKEMMYKEVKIRVDDTPPYIHFFKPSIQLVKNGEAVVLSWLIDENVEQVIIDEVGSIEFGKNSIEVVPTKDTSYTLRAVSYFGKESVSRAFVEVDSTPPTILQFEAYPNPLIKIQPLQIIWQTEGAKYVTIDDYGNFPPNGSADIEVRGDCVLNFIAVSHYDKRIQSKLEITTSKEPPQIIVFQPDRQTLTDAQPATLSWTILNASKVEINHGIGDVSHLSSIDVHTMEDRVYTLTAYSYFGVSTTQELQLNVDKTPPLIKIFESSKEYIVAEKQVELSWEIEGATRVVLMPWHEQVDENGSKTVEIAKDTFVEIVAQNFFGFTSKKQVAIRVLPIPLIESLRVPSLVIEQKISLAYSPVIPAQITSKLVNFKQELQVTPITFQKIDVSLLHPPQQIKEDNLFELIMKSYKEYVAPRFQELKDFINNKFKTV